MYIITRTAVVLTVLTTVLTSESYRCPSQVQNQGNNIAIHDGFCYHYVHSFVPWGTANSHCTENGGHLAVLSSKPVNDFLSQMLLSLEIVSNTVWIGANDVAVEGDWTWVNGASWGFTKWATGFPTYCFNARCNEDCAYLKPTTGEWEDAICKETRSYVCQYVASTTTTRTTQAITAGTTATSMTTNATTTGVTAGNTKKKTELSEGTTATSMTTNATTTGVTTGNTKKTAALSEGWMLIMIVSLLAILLLLAIIIVILVCRNRRLKKKKTNEEVPVRFQNDSYTGMDDTEPYNTLTRSDDEHLYNTIGAVGEDPQYDSIPAEKLRDLDSDYLTPFTKSNKTNRSTEELL